MRSLPFSSFSLFYLLIVGSSFVVNATDSENTKVKNSSSMQAYSGVFNTPNAQVIDWGNLGFSYSDNYTDRAAQFIDQPGFVTANDLKFGVGLLPNLEVVGRLSSRYWDCNSFEESDCGFTDLSGSFKWQVPFIPKNWFSVAVGGQDVAGASSFSEAYYLTASKEFNFNSYGALRTSVGVSSSDNSIGYMDGMIGSVEYQPFEVLQVAAEYDANAVNVGIKAFAPASWLPNGWDLYVSAQLYSSDDEHNERDQWFSAGVSIPLGDTDSLSNASNALRSESAELRGDPETSSGSDVVGSGSDGVGSKVGGTLVSRKAGNDSITERISMLGQRLEDEGFESISVGIRYVDTNSLNNASNTLRSESAALRGDPETSSGSGGVGSGSGGLDSGRGNDGKVVVVRVENNIYNRNEMDAVAVVRHLSLVTLGDVQGAIELTNYGVVSYAEALRGGDPETSSGSGGLNTGSGGLNTGSGGLSTGSDGLSTGSGLGLFSNWFGDDSVNWLVKNENSTHFVPRIILSPKQVSFIGTEYGAFDYQLMLSTNLQMSLWPGAVIDIRHLSGTIANSDDFEDDEFYQRYYGIDEGIDRRMFHQTLSLPYNVFNKFSIGQMDDEFDGLLNETRWADSSNTHRFNLLYGDFESEISAWGGKQTFDHTPTLIKYRYRYRPLNWDIELTAGEYMQGDKGFTLRSLHWFGDVQVGLRYRKTKFDDIDGGEEEDFVALGFSIPLTFGKSMKSNYGVQIRGAEQWDYYVETNLESEGTANWIKTGFGQEPRLYHNLNQAYFNRDRN